MSVKPIACVSEAFGLGRGVRSCGCATSGTAARMPRQIKINLRIANAPFVSKPAGILTLRPEDPAVLEKSPAPAAVDDLHLNVGDLPHAARTPIECASEARMPSGVVPAKYALQRRIVQRRRALPDCAVVEEKIHL